MRESMEIVETKLLLEMSMTKNSAEVRLRGLEQPLNEHLIKIIAFDMADERRGHFAKETTGWLRKIARIRLRPANTPGPAKWYFGLLYDEMFGAVAEMNVAAICEDIAEDYPGALTRNGLSVKQVAHALEAFHRDLANRLSKAETLPALASFLS